MLSVGLTGAEKAEKRSLQMRFVSHQGTQDSRVSNDLFAVLPRRSCHKRENRNKSVPPERHRRVVPRGVALRFAKCCDSNAG